MAFHDSANARKSVDKGRKKGAEAVQSRAKPAPSETFDWDKARRLHRQTVLEIYGPDAEDEEETA